MIELKKIIIFLFTVTCLYSCRKDVGILPVPVIKTNNNLIKNASFEDGGSCSFQNWVIIKDAPLATFSADVPNGGGNCAVKLKLGYTFGGTYVFLDQYITGISGTYIYKLKGWMKDPLIGYGRLFIGKLSGGQFYNSTSRFITSTSANWLNYSVTDTITTQISDTIYVRLNPGADQIFTGDVSFDNIELTKVAL